MCVLGLFFLCVCALCVSLCVLCVHFVYALCMLCVFFVCALCFALCDLCFVLCALCSALCALCFVLCALCFVLCGFLLLIAVPACVSRELSFLLPHVVLEWNVGPFVTLRAVFSYSQGWSVERQKYGQRDKEREWKQEVKTQDREEREKWKRRTKNMNNKQQLQPIISWLRLFLFLLCRFGHTLPHVRNAV